MKEVGIKKDIFLKTLSNHLFNSYDGLHTSANTLVIDNSPIKHMLNLLENVLLFPSWSYKDNGTDRDSDLMEELLPYLLNLLQSQEDLAEYRSSHSIGRIMFYNGWETSKHCLRIIKAIEDWEKSSH